jgi:hypothetical protein
MLVVNLDTITKDFSCVRLPIQGMTHCDSQSRWTIIENVEEISMKFGILDIQQLFFVVNLSLIDYDILLFVK